MAEINIEKMVKRVAEEALDGYIYKGKTLREWIDILAQTQWIPISERLPNECSGVLVYCPENENIFLAYWEIGKWYIFSPNADEPIDEPIVAWMPLPKPYKAESEVQNANSD